MRELDANGTGAGDARRSDAQAPRELIADAASLRRARSTKAGAHAPRHPPTRSSIGAAQRAILHTRGVARSAMTAHGGRSSVKRVALRRVDCFLERLACGEL